MPDEKISKALEYICDNIPHSVIHGGNVYHKRTNTFIVRYAGEWPLDNQFSLRNDLREMFGMEVEFQVE